MTTGTGHVYFSHDMTPPDGQPFEESVYFKCFGEMPQMQLDWNRAIRWMPRAQDPNAGKAPEDPQLGAKTSGYRPSHYWEGGVVETEHYRTHPWVAGHKPDHIGGTMQPVQGTPEFSPFYVEFEEYFGGYNFGGGNCQIDFLNMKLDWACG